MPVASAIIDEAQALLNDPSGSTYTDAILLTLLKKAYAELQRKLTLQEVPILKEATAATTINAGVTTVPTIADLVLPISLKERASTSTLAQDYIDMTEREWEPDESQTETLRYWVWREEVIKLLGATAARHVLVRYWKGLPALSTGADNVAIANSQQFLASRTAALAAAMIAQNMTKAEILQMDANAELDELIMLHTKQKQGLPVRRRAYVRGR